MKPPLKTTVKPIRTLVVDDSVTIRKYLIDLFRQSSEFEVVGEAEDGKRAIEICEKLRPDVMTLDMMLPLMSGLAATEYIMAHFPTPIVIVSGSMNRGELFKTYEALAAGAVDVIDKPGGESFGSDWERRLLSTVRIASRVRVIMHPRGRLRGISSQSATPGNGQQATHSIGFRCVALGASTGGPQALSTLLGSLPGDFPLPILIVMHISTGFGDAFAGWLNDQSDVPVTTAIDGEALPPVGAARVILAPPDCHMIVREGRIALTHTPEVNSCRPSVDLLFESVADELGPRVIAALLTGMGRDGARGLRRIRDAGGTTLVQDETSSVIFGMPREAILLGAAQRVLPLNEIGPAIRSLAAAPRALER